MTTLGSGTLYPQAAQYFLRRQEHPVHRFVKKRFLYSTKTLIANYCPPNHTYRFEYVFCGVVTLLLHALLHEIYAQLQVKVLLLQRCDLLWAKIQKRNRQDIGSEDKSTKPA